MGVGEYLAVNGVFTAVNTIGAIFVAIRDRNVLPLVGVAVTAGIHFWAVNYNENNEVPQRKMKSGTLFAGVGANVLATATWFVGMPWPVALFSGGLGTAANVFFVMMSGFAA